MGKRKKQNEWMAIVSLDQGKGVRPIVIHDGDEIATFSSRDEIEKIRDDHLLLPFVWSAFNFVTGDLEVLG